MNTLPTIRTTTANLQTTSKPPFITGQLIYNCSFDGFTLTTLCGGITTNSVPISSLALFSIQQNELIENSNPSMVITDVKSISINNLSFTFKIIN